jgi:hypothetical protein
MESARLVVGTAESTRPKRNRPKGQSKRHKAIAANINRRISTNQPGEELAKNSKHLPLKQTQPPPATGAHPPRITIRSPENTHRSLPPQNRRKSEPTFPSGAFYRIRRARIRARHRRKPPRRQRVTLVPREELAAGAEAEAERKYQAPRRRSSEVRAAARGGRRRRRRRSEVRKRKRKKGKVRVILIPRQLPPEPL